MTKYFSCKTNRPKGLTPGCFGKIVFRIVSINSDFWSEGFSPTANELRALDISNNTLLIPCPLSLLYEFPWIKFLLTCLHS